MWFSADRLVERIGPRELRRHLEALQEIAGDHGGDRETGSDGFEASMAYVEGVLRSAGHTPERQAFSVEGVTGANLVVDWPGTGPGVVILGAHLDTVAGSPGMNDNGSGVAAVLAIGEALAGLPAPPRTIRLAIWDAEEGGPFGSRAHVAALAPRERDRVVAYLNLDMIASPNALRFVYAEAGSAPGSDAITERFAAYLDAAGLPWDAIDLEGDSDHGPFIASGIATGGLFGGGIEPVTEAQAARFDAIPGVPADACSHRPCDTLDNVDPATHTELTRAAAHVLGALAEDAPP
jgi:aminopeptidase S